MSKNQSYTGMYFVISNLNNTLASIMILDLLLNIPAHLQPAKQKIQHFLPLIFLWDSPKISLWQYIQIMEKI